LPLWRDGFTKKKMKKIRGAGAEEGKEMAVFVQGLSLGGRE